VRARLGEGGMGTVYRVHDREIGRDVALKTMRRLGPDQILGLKKEFRSRAGLAHRNLLQLYELFVDDSLCFFTMELVEGKDIVSWARRDLAIRSAASERDAALFESTLGRARSNGGLQPTLSSSSVDAPEPLVSVAPQAPRAGSAPEIDLRSPSSAADHAWTRLRHGFVGLIEGLCALHESGRVHRDVKPANVLVGDRVILLDFGLATELQGASDERAPRIEGTPAYMAPEQVLRRPVSPAADLYAVGVMLYEVLTGGLPFSGSTMVTLHNKVHLAPRSARALAPEAPADLADLAMDLLVTAPEARPSAEQCVARLTRGLDAVAAPQAAPKAALERPFVGRAGEIEALEGAFREVTERRAQVTVAVHGASGIGKSRLVREFLAAQSRARDPLILSGRCHPQESVPYKALDAAVDAIAQHLDTLPPGAVEALLPTNAHALVRIFPVLAKLPAFSRAPEPSAQLEAIEVRAQGFRALGELFARLSERRPLILWLDDVQWGDIDSALLLEELLRDPAPPFLLLLTFRSDERDTSPLLRHLTGDRGAEGRARVREVALGALAPEHVTELARALLGRAGPSVERQLQSVVAHAEGNPFIAGEMALYLSARAAGGGAEAALGNLDAAQVVLERIRSLEPDQRALLEVASIASAPVSRSVALAAAGLDETARPLVAELRDANLLREIAAEGTVSVAAYHDRIREVLVGSMPAEDRRARHRGIAEALTARSSTDFDALLIHWEGAGDARRAGEHAVRAADRAAAALAFDNAAALYMKSLALLGPHADRAGLLGKLGDVLANRGRAAEAADRYLEAAAALGGGASRRVHDLKRRAAEQYIKSGRIDQGWREMRSVLEALRIPVPGSVLGAVASSAWRRAAFLLQRVDVERRAFTPAPPDEQYRMDVLWSATTGWAMINHTLADMFRVMHLRWAVRSGSASTLCRSLAYESAMEVHVGGRFFDDNARKLLAKVEHLARRTGDPYDRAWQDLALANVGYTHGRWRETAEACARADEVFRQRCPGSAWERVTVGIFFHHALAMLGDLNRLRPRLAEFYADASLRGDIYASCEAYINEPVLAWLADDKVEEARERASSALAAQSVRTTTWPENAYRRQHFADLVALVYAAAYRGDPWPAWRAVLAQWPALEGAFLLPLRVTGLGVRHARARAALAAATARTGDGGAPPAGVDRRWSRRALLDDARAQVKKIAADQVGCAEPIARMIRAGIARQSGERREAERELAGALAGFEREEMALYREAARYALGELRGGAEGAGLVRRAEAWMAEQGVVRPRALVAAVAPGTGVAAE
jgi:serine/threonine protein kinase/tetratricopeptide (TPR) repeat protein